MAKKIRRATGKKKSITLRDVVNHMGNMEQRLASQIQGLDKRLTGRVDGLDQKMDYVEKKLTERIDSLEVNLTNRIDALEEDLIATMKDTVKIRKHVGMAVQED